MCGVEGRLELQEGMIGRVHCHCRVDCRVVKENVKDSFDFGLVWFVFSCPSLSGASLPYIYTSTSVNFKHLTIHYADSMMMMMMIMMTMMMIEDRAKYT